MDIRKILIVGLAAMMLLSGCSSSPAGTSSSEAVSSLPPQAVSEPESSGETSEILPESSLPSSSSPAVSSSSSAESSASNLFPETSSLAPAEGKDTAFTFKDGVYTKITGTNALFVIAKDFSSITDEKKRTKEEKTLAQKTMETYYMQGYYCVAAIVKPDQKDTVDLTKTRSDTTLRVLKRQKGSDVSTLTSPILSKQSIQDYMNGQIKK